MAFVYLQDEHCINTPEEIKEVDSDSYFMLKDNTDKRYHFECQSILDTVVLFLRYTRNTTNTMHIYVETSRGRVLQEVRVMKLKNLRKGYICCFRSTSWYMLASDKRLMLL